MQNIFSFLSLFSKKRVSAKEDNLKIPTHIALIMDGNRRWADKKRLPRVAGYKFGIDAVKDIYSSCVDLGVKYLTIYAFSTENMKRPKNEVDYLNNLFSEALSKETDPLLKKNIKLRILGRINDMESISRERIAGAEKKTAHCTGLNLQVMFNYGGRAEIIDAVRKISSRIKAGEDIKVDEKLISDTIYTAGMPDPDLLIRTGGDMRVSNFLLWQIAYSEIYVTETLFPDFRREQLIEAIKEFSRRARRFGKE